MLNVGMGGRGKDGDFLNHRQLRVEKGDKVVVKLVGAGRKSARWHEQGMSADRERLTIDGRDGGTLLTFAGAS